MQGRRLEKTGGVTYYTRPPQTRQEALLPEGIRWGFRAEHDADARRSFAAVEWHYSDRLLHAKVNIESHSDIEGKWRGRRDLNPRLPD